MAPVQQIYDRHQNLFAKKSHPEICSIANVSHFIIHIFYHINNINILFFKLLKNYFFFDILKLSLTIDANLSLRMIVCQKLVVVLAYRLK